MEKYKALLSEKKALDAIMRFYKTKSDTKKFELIIRKHVKDVFLRHSILWWHNNLLAKDKAAGLQIITEMWENEEFASVLDCLPGNLNRDNESLKKIE